MKGRKALANVPIRSSKIIHKSNLPRYFKSKFKNVVFPSSLLNNPAITVLRVPRNPKNYGLHSLLYQKPLPDKSRRLPLLDPGQILSTRMLNWVQVISTPTADTSGTSILLHFDNQRYVFGGISEGTQRAMSQRKIGLNKVEDIFMTGVVNWHNAGGLLGIILTLADITATAAAAANEDQEGQNAEKKNNSKKGRSGLGSDGVMSRLNIHGGRNLSHLLATCRRFVFRRGFPLKPHEIRHDPRLGAQKSNEPDFKDANINVWYMPVESSNIRPDSSRKRSHEEFAETTDDHSGQNIQSSSTLADEAEKLVETVVAHMFDSDWTMDALMETTLHKARLPAKLFVRNNKGHIQVYDGPLPGGNQSVPDIPVLVRQPWPGATIESLPRTTPSTQSMCYIVKGHDRRGKFNPKEAIKHSVAKPDYRLLTRGESVTGKDGTIVTPEMVLGDNVLGKGFAVVDLPDTSFVDALVNRAEWSNQEIMKEVHIIFWILGSGVSNDSRLQEFMTKTSSIRHIVTSADDCPDMLALESVATQAYKLHCIDPERFPLPIFSNTPATPSTPAYEIGRTGKTIQFAPQFLHQDDKIIPFADIQKLASSDLSKDARAEIQQLTDRARAKVADPEFQAKIEKVESDIPNRDAEVITLGTGSALPSKYRNVSATLLRVPGHGNYLFDCGENTLGQLRRVFGDELPAVLRDLKAVWISHLHADHHLGTAGVIRAWRDATFAFSEETAKSQLLVASHVHMLDWLREYADVEDYGYDRLVPYAFEHYDNAAARVARPPRPLTPLETRAFGGLGSIDACFVHHCHGALATVFTWPSTGLKVAYSGDCRPSDAFARIGRGATLLIHESTFDDELKGDAIAKRHSTMSEAIGVGRRMGARRIMLTHFSQRYQKVPVFEESFGEEQGQGQGQGRKKDEVVLVAFDYMRVRIGDFRKAQAFLPAVQKLFEDVGAQ